MTNIINFPSRKDDLENIIENAFKELPFRLPQHEQEVKKIITSTLKEHENKFTDCSLSVPDTISDNDKAHLIKVFETEQQRKIELVAEIVKLKVRELMSGLVT